MCMFIFVCTFMVAHWCDLLILTLTNVWEYVFEPVSLQETHGYSSIIFCTNLVTYDIHIHLMVEFMHLP